MFIAALRSFSIDEELSNDSKAIAVLIRGVGIVS
jgi:hypothetical protein